jgi:hypothetical protein
MMYQPWSGDDLDDLATILPSLLRRRVQIQPRVTLSLRNGEPRGLVKLADRVAVTANSRATLCTVTDSPGATVALPFNLKLIAVAVWPRQRIKCRSGEVSAPKVGASEVGASEVGAPKVGATEICVQEIGAPKVGASEVSTTKGGAQEAGETEICVLETGAPKVGITEGGAIEVGALSFETIRAGPDCMPT